MRRREQTKVSDAPDTDARRRDAVVMKDAELLKMAAFKVHECAERMFVLARTAESLALQMTFLSLRHELIQEEERLHQLGGLKSPHNSADQSAAFRVPAPPDFSGKQPAEFVR